MMKVTQMTLVLVLMLDNASGSSKKLQKEKDVDKDIGILLRNLNSSRINTGEDWHIALSESKADGRNLRRVTSDHMVGENVLKKGTACYFIKEMEVGNENTKKKKSGKTENPKKKKKGSGLFVVKGYLEGSSVLQTIHGVPKKSLEPIKKQFYCDPQEARYRKLIEKEEVLQAKASEVEPAKSSKVENFEGISKRSLNPISMHHMSREVLNVLPKARDAGGLYKKGEHVQLKKGHAHEYKKGIVMESYTQSQRGNAGNWSKVLIQLINCKNRFTGKPIQTVAGYGHLRRICHVGGAARLREPTELPAKLIQKLPNIFKKLEAGQKVTKLRVSDDYVTFTTADGKPHKTAKVNKTNWHTYFQLQPRSPWAKTFYNSKVVKIEKPSNVTLRSFPGTLQITKKDVTIRENMVTLLPIQGPNGVLQIPRKDFEDDLVTLQGPNGTTLTIPQSELIALS